jgi:glycerol uptake facilitator-like aquaporin
METDLRKDDRKFIFLYEFCGTALILYAVNVSHGNPVAVVFSIMVSVLFAGPITGAHFNPAVSTACLISHTNPREALSSFALMVSAEITGALFGVLLAFLSLTTN